MHRNEAIGWLRVAAASDNDRWATYQNLPELHVAGHGGWASYFDYSVGFLNRKNGYTHLLEIHAPDFTQWMTEIGVSVGKGENDDLSWGIGKTKSNGFKPDSASNKFLKKAYDQMMKDKGNPPGTEKSSVPLRQSKDVTPYIFCFAILYARVVGLRVEPANRASGQE